MRWISGNIGIRSTSTYCCIEYSIIISGCHSKRRTTFHVAVSPSTPHLKMSHSSTEDFFYYSRFQINCSWFMMLIVRVCKKGVSGQRPYSRVTVFLNLSIISTDIIHIKKRGGGSEKNWSFPYSPTKSKVMKLIHFLFLENSWIKNILHNSFSEVVGQ